MRQDPLTIAGPGICRRDILWPTRAHLDIYLGDINKTKLKIIGGASVTLVAWFTGYVRRRNDTKLGANC
jgi:hypothetical protein